MRNRFPGPCYRCGTLVEASAGHFERHPTASGKWRTQHVECAIHHRGRDVPPLTDAGRASIRAVRREMMDKRWGKVRSKPVKPDLTPEAPSCP